MTSSNLKLATKRVRCRPLQLPLLPMDWHSITFQKIVPKENCYRAYEISIQPAEDGWIVLTKRGRIGGTMRPLEDHCRDKEEALATARWRAHKRLLHGYQVVHVE